MPDQNSLEEPVSERDDKHDDPWGTAMDRLGLRSPQGTSESAQSPRLSACPTCGHVKLVHPATQVRQGDELVDGLGDAY